MTENPIVRRAAGRGGATEAVDALRSSQDVVYVDVGARRIESKVVRDGIPILAQKINEDVLRNVILSRPEVVFRIVSQSIAPGTAVPVGATIDVQVARPGTLPVGMVTGVHAAVADESVDDAFQRLVAHNPPQVRRLVALSAEGPLSAADAQAVRQIFNTADISVDDNVPGQDLTAAVETLRMLVTFGGT
jgi:hypothetical protein